MKALVVHNRYRSASPSGETQTVDDEVERLRSSGITVETFSRSSDEIADFGWFERLRLPFAPITGASSRQDFRHALATFGPDLVHLHNPYPLISPSVISDCNDAGVPVVVTVQNFRLRCANGLFFRQGDICTECEGRAIPWPAVVHGCYRESRLQSLAMAAALVHHRETWQGVDRFIAVSGFVASKLVEWGLPSSRVVVKPNAIADPGDHSTTGNGVLFAGRLSPEKGVELLLDAWGKAKPSVRLTIAGEGPLRAELEMKARALHADVAFVGNLGSSELGRTRRDNALSVVPSLWYEAHPLTIVESLAWGRSVVATNVGSLPDAVDSSVGWSVDTTVDQLAAALSDATSGDAAQTKGRAARQRYLDRYHPTVVTRELVAIYNSVLAQ